MVYSIQIRHGDSNFWSQKNPVLLVGEPALEEDTGRQKIGDGKTAWNNLPYFSLGEDGAASKKDLDDHVNSQTPHPVYDDGPSLLLLYLNVKV